MDIIIETPKGSNVKYTFVQHGLYRLKKKLAPGLSFPFDFGFIPGTLGEDGDPLDVLVISEFTGFPGCITDCRIIGCLVAEQGKKGKIIRNDRYLAVPEISTIYASVNSLADLPGNLLATVSSFINYMQAEGKHFRILETLDADAARELVATAPRL